MNKLCFVDSQTYFCPTLYISDTNSSVLMFQGYLRQRKFSFEVLFKGLVQLVTASYSHAQNPSTVLLLKVPVTHLGFSLKCIF